MKTRIRAALAVASLLCLACPAQASVVYSYTGSAYTSVSNSSPNTSYLASYSVSGSFTLADGDWANHDGAISPLSYDFFDGVSHYTAGNVNSASFFLRTDAASAVTRWNIDLLDLLPGGGWNHLVTHNIGGGNEDSGEHFDGPGCSGGCSSAALTFQVGTWSVAKQPDPGADPGTGAVPEPQSLALTLLALLALPVVRSARRRR